MIETKRVARHYALEGAVIVAGILIALGADALWSYRIDRVDEQVALRQLDAELESNATQLDSVRTGHLRGLEAATSLLSAIRDDVLRVELMGWPGVVEDYREYEEAARAYAYATQFAAPSEVLNGYEEILLELEVTRATLARMRMLPGDNLAGSANKDVLRSAHGSTCASRALAGDLEGTAAEFRTVRWQRSYRIA